MVTYKQTLNFAGEGSDEEEDLVYVQRRCVVLD
jgi:hypothetical protein